MCAKTHCPQKIRNYTNSNICKKALGLVEVLVALLLVATTMILAVRTVSRGLATIKDNEVQDRSVGVMLRAIELNQLSFPPEINPSNVGIQKECYTLSNIDLSDESTDQQNLDTSLLDKLTHVASNCEEITENTNQSEIESYKVGSLQGINVYNQIIYSNATQSTQDGPDVRIVGMYKITSVVVYQTSGEFRIDKINTYKRIGGTTILPTPTPTLTATPLPTQTPNPTTTPTATSTRPSIPTSTPTDTTSVSGSQTPTPTLTKPSNDETILPPPGDDTKK